MMEGCQGRGRMSAREASAILGKANFILTTAYGAVGRAATQPFLQRAARPDDGLGFTAAMGASLAFFHELFAALPPKQIPVAEDARPHVLVYTDACYNEPDGFSGVGVVVIDTETGAIWEAGGEVPAAIMAWMRQRGQQINQLEQLAAACARLTFPGAMAGRRVLHFIDNTSALSASVHGYAGAADMAAFVNALHLSDALMGVDPWYEWVPSKANISDLPSRSEAEWSAEDADVMGELRSRPGYQGPGS